MQQNRIINRTAVAVHRNESACACVHISRTEIIQSCYWVKLLTCKQEVIFCTANAAYQVAKCVINIFIGNLALILKLICHILCICCIYFIFTNSFPFGYQFTTLLIILTKIHITSKTDPC